MDALPTILDFLLLTSLATALVHFCNANMGAPPPVLEDSAYVPNCPRAPEGTKCPERAPA
jgi:hypothetical protein